MSLHTIRRSAFGVLLFLLVLPLVAEGQEVSAPGEAEASERRPIDPDALKEGKAPVDLLNAPGLSRGVDAIIEEIRKREIEIALREQRIAERERAVVEETAAAWLALDRPERAAETWAGRARAEEADLAAALAAALAFERAGATDEAEAWLEITALAAPGDPRVDATRGEIDAARTRDSAGPSLED